MKKLILVFLILVTVLMLVSGCTNTEVAPTDSPQDSGDDSQPSEDNSDDDVSDDIQPPALPSD